MEQKVRNSNILGDNIARLRAKSGLPQSQVVRNLQLFGIDMSRSYYSHIEIGRLNVAPEVLAALKRIFECEYDDFFVGVEDRLDKLAATGKNKK